MKKHLIRSIGHLYFLAAFTLLMTRPVHAYIDPSVMTYAIQAVAGIAIALGAAFSILWRKVRKKLFKNNETHYQTVESDDVSFTDPADRTVIRALDGIDAQPVKTAKTNKKKKLTPKERVIRTILELLPAILLVSAFAFMIAFYAPLEVYMNNKTEFWYDYAMIRPELLKMTFSIIKKGVLIYLFAYLLHKKFYDELLVLGLVFFVCTYVQGNFLAAHMPPMDGETVVWADYAADMTQSWILWFIGITVTVLLSRFLKRKFYLFTDFVCVAVSVMLGVSLISINVRNEGTKNKPEGMVVTMDGLYEFSTDQNFIIFVLDAMDAQYVKACLEEHPEYAENLDGFTFFPDTLAAYPFTLTSIPFILSGSWFEAQKPRTEFQTESLDNSPLLANLEEAGYTLYAHDDGSLTYESKNAERFKNIRVVPKEISDTGVLQDLLYRMTWYKYAPFFVKEQFEVNVDDFAATERFDLNGEMINMTEHKGCDDLIYHWKDKCNYSAIKDKKTYTLTDEKVFHFYHIEGAHKPFNLNENVETISTDDGNYKMKVAAAMKIASAYVTKLKELGIYDNTTILIMGDHGYNVNKPGKTEGYGRQNVMLMVKGFNEHHDFNISGAPISYDDLQTAYERLMNGSSSEDAFDAKEGDQRERRFLFHRFAHMENLEEFILRGTADDDSALEPTGVEYSRD